MKNLLFILGGAALLASSALASTEVVNCSVASGLTELGAPTSGKVTCGSDGGITGVTAISITITGAIVNPSSSVTLTNGSTSTQIASGTTNSQFSLDATGLLPDGVTFSPFTVNAGTGNKSIAAGGTTGAVAVSGTANTGAISVPLADLAQFAPGFNFIADTLTGLTILGSGGNISGAQVTDASVTATITYTYSTGVPEPTTFGLLGASLVGLGLLKRRMFQKK